MSRPPESQVPALEAALRCLRARRPVPLVVGFSGGLDSTVLLHRLAQEPVLRSHGLRAVHVHHGWSPDADAWAGHCVQFCHVLGIPLTLLHVTLTQGPGAGGMEAAARRARYAAVAGILAAEEWFLTAHHADDQAETLLLQLLRGAGLEGLGGMRERGRVMGARVWRPLLGVPRSAVLSYARTQGLQWIEDPSNVYGQLARGMLRTRVWPTLLAHWPGLVATLGHSAAHLRADRLLLRAQTRNALAACRTLDPAVLDGAALLGLPVGLPARVLRLWLRERGCAPPPRTWIERLLAELASLAADAQPRWRHGATVLKAWRGLLAHRPPVDPPLWSIDVWDGSSLVLPHGLGVLIWEGPARCWSLGARCGGESLRWQGRRRPLKHVLQALGVPIWQRDRLVLLHERLDDGSRVLRAVAGVLLDDHLHGLLAAGARLDYAAGPGAG